jgi:type IV secretion system protein TrbL
MNRLALLLAALAIALVCSDGAYAAESTQTLDKIVQLYQQNAQKWESTLRGYAQTLFWLLATIEIAYTGIKLVLRNADFNEWAGELVSQILFIGFFSALLTNSSTWATAIVNSFRNAANQAVQASGGQSGIAPSDIFGTGLTLGNKILDQASLWDPGAAIGIILFALVVVVCTALIAAFVIVALVESYIVISAGVLFMGFGGSRWTKDFALKIIVYAVSVGAKLFVLQLIAGMGQQVFNDLVSNFSINTSDILVSIGAAIVMLALSWTIPDIVQSLINGTSTGRGDALTGAAGAIASGTLGTAGRAGLAGGRAFRLASEQVAAGEGGSKTGRTLRNLAGASGDTVGARLSGRGFLGQMAQALKGRADQRRAGSNAKSGDGTVSGSGPAASPGAPGSGTKKK